MVVEVISGSRVWIILGAKVARVANLGVSRGVCGEWAAWGIMAGVSAGFDRCCFVMVALVSSNLKS